MKTFCNIRDTKISRLRLIEMDRRFTLSLLCSKLTRGWWWKLKHGQHTTVTNTNTVTGVSNYYFSSYIVMSRKIVRMKICGFQEAYIRKSQKTLNKLKSCSIC